MDEIVKAAMQKWPNVPNCYGWLGLDARGNWRMRDEHAQKYNLAGDKIRNTTLIGFIERNYTHDAQGNWYFQNGPQKVYVDLSATPYIVHALPDDNWKTHAGEIMPTPDYAYLLDDGNIVFQAHAMLYQVDDRDLVTALDNLRRDGNVISEEDLFDLLKKDEGEIKGLTMWFDTEGTEKIQLKVKRSSLTSLMQANNFQSMPR